MRKVLSSYQLTEEEASGILVRFIQVPELKKPLSDMLATASLELVAQEVLRLGRKWRPSQNIYFPKPEEQSFTAYLQEIRRRAKASGTLLGDDAVVNFILGQVKDEVLRQRLYDYVDDLDALVEVSDDSVIRTAQIRKATRELAPASVTRIEAVKAEADQNGPAPEQEEISAAAATTPFIR